MTKSAIKEAARLFMNCQAMIHNPKPLNYKELAPFLANYISKDEYKQLTLMCEEEKDFIMSSTEEHIDLIMIEIKTRAQKLSALLSHNERTVFITVLLKLIRYNGQETNMHIAAAIQAIAETFSYNPEQAVAIKKLIAQKEPTVEDFSNSVLVTNTPPDYTQVIDGLKVIYSPDYKFKIWIKNIRSVNNMLANVIEIDEALANYYMVKAGEIRPYFGAIQYLLETYSITFSNIASRVVEEISAMQRVEISGSARSPRISINPAEHRMEISGIVLMRESEDFFKPVFHWLEKAKKLPIKKLNLHFVLDSFNAYSARIILKIIQDVVQLETCGCKTKIYWHYENDEDEIKDAGQYYASIVNREFVYVPAPELVAQSV